MIYHISIDCFRLDSKYIEFLVGWIFSPILTPFYRSVFWHFFSPIEAREKLCFEKKEKRFVWDGYKEGIESRMFVFMRLFFLLHSEINFFFLIQHLRCYRFEEHRRVKKNASHWLKHVFNFFPVADLFCWYVCVPFYGNLTKWT